MYKYLTIIFLVLLDIFVKKIIFNSINLNSFIYINSFFDLAHIHNFGISFGLFSGLFSSWLFVFIGIMITIFLYTLFLNATNSLEKWGYTYILAGALGNIIDRIINGYVIDFIYLHYNDFYWPAFNFADIYITIGVCIIIFHFLLNLDKTKKT
tara:strand:- start:38 stop:496 length:459 start_codon:yes stop_codon:yes gene_type:complete